MQNKISKRRFEIEKRPVLPRVFFALSKRLSLLAAKDFAVFSGKADVLAGEAVFVIVPADDFDVLGSIRILVNHRLSGIEDRTMGVAQDIARDDRIFGVAEEIGRAHV